MQLKPAWQRCIASLKVNHLADWAIWSYLVTPSFIGLGCSSPPSVHSASHQTFKTYELPHDKTNKLACTPRKDSDQPGCPKGHCSAKVMPNSHPEGQSFLSIPNSHGRFFSLHTLSVFIAFCHFKCETFTNILTETLFFCSCGYNYIINLVQRLQLHVYIIGRVVFS